jgi:excisionase family DNA binding protein
VSIVTSSKTATYDSVESPMLVSVEKAASLLGVHPRTVYRMLADGELPFVKIGRRTLLSVASLENWIVDHEVPVQMADTA